MVKKPGFAPAKRVSSAGGMKRSESQKTRNRDQSAQAAHPSQGPGTRASGWERRYRITPETEVQDQRPSLQAPGSGSAAPPPWKSQGQAGDDPRVRESSHSRSSSQSSRKPKSMVGSSSNGSHPLEQRQQKKYSGIPSDTAQSSPRSNSSAASSNGSERRLGESFGDYERRGNTTEGKPPPSWPLADFQTIDRRPGIPKSRGSYSSKDEKGVPYRPAYPSSTPAAPSFPELAASLLKEKKDTAKKGPRGTKGGKSKRKNSIGQQRREGEERASSSQPGTRVDRAILTPNQSRTATSASDSEGSSSQSSRTSIRTLDSAKGRPHYSWAHKDYTEKS